MTSINNIFDPKDLSEETHQARLTAINAVPEFTSNPAFIINNCHITLEAFLRFLNGEHNSENLRCLLELKAIRNFVKQEKEKTIHDDQQDDALPSKTTNVSFASKILKDVKNLFKKAEANPELKKLLLMERMLVLLFARCDQLFQDFVSTKAKYEVNINGKCRVIVEADFAQVQTTCKKYEQERESIPVPERFTMVQQAMDQIDTFMMHLESDLLFNMADPFSRFIKSVEFRDSVATFIAMSDDSGLRMKLMGPQKDPVVLNTFKKDSLNRSATSVAEYLVYCWQAIAGKQRYWVTYSTHVDFDYSKLRGANVCVFLEHYKKAVGDLQSVSIELLQTAEERTAFFVNIYNCLMLHTAIILQGIPTSIDTWSRIAAKSFYNIGGKLFSLVDIEKILKQQTSSSTKSIFSTGTDNTRAELIQFLLVTVTRQSPSLVLVKSTTLKEQIKTAAKQHIQANLITSPKPNGELVIILPELLASNCKLIQKNLKVLSQATNTLGSFVYSCLSDEQQKAVQQATKVVCAVNPFHVTQTDFACLVHAQANLKDVFDEEIMQALVQE